MRNTCTSVIINIRFVSRLMNYLELSGTLVGLIYLWLEYRASVYLWVASLIMPAIYIVVYYQAGLYADLGINVYYVLASLYGMIYWTFGHFKKKNQSLENVSETTAELPITHTPRRLILPLGVVTGVLTVAIAQVLIHFTDSNVPWADSFTTALSIVAMWMLAKKYAEQWLAWIAVDAVCAVLYIYKALYFTSALYLLYTLIAYFGYLKWKQLIKN